MPGTYVPIMSFVIAGASPVGLCDAYEQFSFPKR